MAKKKKSQPRQKHVPMRTCVVCREVKPKRQLTRLVIGQSDALIDDPGGKAPGRGAYLCDNPACWHGAAQGNALEKALRSSLKEEDRVFLAQCAAGLEAVAENN